MSEPNSAYLASVPLFQTLPFDALARLAERTNTLAFASGETVFFKGDPADFVYVVVDGEFIVEVPTRDGRAVSLNSLSSRHVFGELAVLDGGVRSANVRAIRASRLLAIPAAVFLDLIDAHSGFARRIISDVIGRLRASDWRVELVTTATLRSRLAAALLDLHAARGDVIDITQSALAERLSATREKVNVNLQFLREAGAITLARGQIYIVRPDILARFKPGD